MEYKAILCTVLGFYTPLNDGKELIIKYGRLVQEAKERPKDIMSNSYNLKVKEGFEFIPMKEFIELIEGQYEFIKSLIIESNE